MFRKAPKFESIGNGTLRTFDCGQIDIAHIDRESFERGMARGGLAVPSREEFAKALGSEPEVAHKFRDKAVLLSEGIFQVDWDCVLGKNPINFGSDSVKSIRASPEIDFSKLLNGPLYFYFGWTEIFSIEPSGPARYVWNRLILVGVQRSASEHTIGLSSYLRGKIVTAFQRTD